jgi:hypothetical protein
MDGDREKESIRLESKICWKLEIIIQNKLDRRVRGDIFDFRAIMSAVFRGETNIGTDSEAVSDLRQNFTFSFYIKTEIFNHEK